MVLDPKVKGQLLLVPCIVIALVFAGNCAAYSGTLSLQTPCVDTTTLLNRITQWEQGSIGMTSLISNIAQWKSGASCSTDFPQDFIAYYKFENNANDETGTHNGVTYGTPQYLNGQDGLAISFDGTNDYIRVSKAGKPLNITGNEVTISFWVNGRNFGQYSKYLAGIDETSTSPWKSQYFLRYQGSPYNSARFLINTATSGGSYYGSTQLSNNQWHHLAGVYDGSNMYLYVDGIEEGNPVPLSGNIVSNSLDFSIGQGLGSGASLDFDGMIDELLVYDRALSASEIREIFTAQGGSLTNINVTLDSSTQYQTIIGWGGGVWSPPSHTMALQEEILRESVNDFGISGLRGLAICPGNCIDVMAWDDVKMASQPWEWFNDDGDPNNFNWSGFNTAVLDKHIQHYLLPFKQAVEANGDRYDMFTGENAAFKTGSYGSVTPAWILHNPGEHIENVLSLPMYLKNNYNVDVTYITLDGEPGYNDPFTAPMMANLIKLAVPRIQALGLAGEINFPCGLNPAWSWSYINTLQSEPNFWPYIKLVDYHLYGTPYDPYRSQIYNFASSKGIPTMMSEFSGGATIDVLYDDLALGGVSYWHVSSSSGQVFEHITHNRLGHRGHYWNLRQVLHYVRPGATRIEATSNNANVKSLAFTDSGGTKVILINGSGSRTVSVDNLPQGTYGVSRSVNNAAITEQGIQTVGSSGSLLMSLPSSSVTTIYPYSGTNMPPTMTDWQSTTDFVTLPSTSTTLSATATDPELDAISYSWSVVSQPSGASVSLATPNAATTTATGMTVAGDYLFRVTASDSAGSVIKEVRVTVFPNNQPPMVFDVHNRDMRKIKLPDDFTTIRGDAIDLEGDPITYQWTLISQPYGANAQLAVDGSHPNWYNVTNMSVAGNYVFRFAVSDPTHTVYETLTVPVYPANPNAPVISSASASPSAISLPTSSTYLSAVTSDPDGDVISHWWTVSSKPSGAADPVFSSQGSRNTTVSNLTSAGTYTFTLTAVDETEYTTRNVSVTVT